MSRRLPAAPNPRHGRAWCRETPSQSQLWTPRAAPSGKRWAQENRSSGSGQSRQAPTPHFPPPPESPPRRLRSSRVLACLPQTLTLPQPPPRPPQQHSEAEVGRGRGKGQEWGPGAGVGARQMHQEAARLRRAGGRQECAWRGEAQTRWLSLLTALLRSPRYSPL